MDVIGSFMSRDVFVAVRLSEREGSQREVMTDSSGQVDFPFWRLTSHDHLSDD